MSKSSLFPANPVPLASDDRETAVGRDLILLANVVVRLEERGLKTNVGLSYRQMRILKHLYGGVRSASDLSKQFGVSAPAISETLESLVRRGYVSREAEASDRRAVRLVLTEAGSDLYLEAQRLEDELARSLIRELDAAGVNHLSELLEIITSPALHDLLEARQGAK